jgi:hypothetical protein
MRRMLKPGEFYLGDRYYGADHGLFRELDEVGSGYVLRLNNATILEVVENHPIPPEAAAQGIISVAMMKIGAKGGGGIRRVIILQGGT